MLKIDHRHTIVLIGLFICLGQGDASYSDRLKYTGFIYAELTSLPKESG